MLVFSSLNKSDENAIHFMETVLQKWSLSNDSKSKKIQNQWDAINLERIINNNFTFDSNLDMAPFKSLQRKNLGRG